MLNLSSFFDQGVHSTLRVKPGVNWSHKGQWVQIFNDTEIDRWYVGDFSSASYQITVEYNSNKKEILNALVVARPSEASIVIYGRVSIDDELITLTATVNDSYLSLKASPTIESFAGAKLIFLATYAQTINDLTVAEALTYVVTQEDTPGSGSGSASSSGIASNSFSSIAVNGQSTVVADSSTDTLTLVAGPNITITTNPATDTLTISGSGSVTASNSFSSIAVSGQSNVVADTSTDTLTLVAGPNITITTNPATDTLTISAASGGTSSGVSTGTVNRLAYYASTGAVVQDTGAELTWNGTNLNITGTVTATGDVSYIRAYFDTLAGLQAVSASTWHGMVAHVHEGGGRMYYAHGGAWQPMSNYSDLNIFKTIVVAGQPNVVADTATDTLTLVAGTNVTITTNAVTDTITINATGGGASDLDSLTDVVITGTPSIGQVLKYNGSNWINDTDATSIGGGGGTVTSVGGTGTVNGLTLSGTVTSTGNLTLGGTLSGVNLASAVLGTLPVANGGTGTSTPGLVQGTNVTISGAWPNQTINATAGSSGISFSISASGSSDYIFSGPGIESGNTNDPVLYLYKGFTYTFVNTTGGAHPFAIRVSNGGASYTPGVSGSQTGTQTFTVPMNAPSTLYYQCTIHSVMGNVINIV